MEQANSTTAIGRVFTLGFCLDLAGNASLLFTLYATAAKAILS